MILNRNLTSHIKKMIGKFPVVSVTGPRQSGKTTMLRNFFPGYKYFNLERLDYRELIRNDIIGFLKNAGNKIIFDEAQNLPELFSYIQVITDQNHGKGKYILSGSQSFLLNQNISQSLAGRVSINHLFPFDITELPPSKTRDPLKLIVNGFYPRVYDKKIKAQDFYPSYLQTYIERDIRTLKAIENLSTFTRFLGLCAGRVGQILNLTSLANDAGISVNTAKSWLSLLEASFVIYLLKPYYVNFNKRIIKSPKLYFYDTGVVCSLLNIKSPEILINHYAYGALFENLIISELIKYHYHKGKIPQIYYWRESNGTEIDCIIEKSPNEILALEIKGGETFTNDYLKNLRKLPDKENRLKIRKKLIYMGKESFDLGKIQITGWNDFKSFLQNFK